ncbi:MAG TPA: glycoside hydrolase family 3 C-terminal domain-containing protein [Humibacter sp.]|nr:glycoside hydrolase family 3 C-terminal domain-containing protein [Humibacter sp.]
MTQHDAVFRRTDVSTHERARDLLQLLTRDERIAMLHQWAPAIERLGIRAFRTGSEALHGVAWLGTATTFPQPVGLATTWDADLLRAVGEVTSIEVRAKRAVDGVVGLNVWAPAVNTLRHPAWGRNEEGYSEDPHLTAHLAGAYSRGLRGDHERVWRTVPTLKHFLAYNNETDRSTTSSNMSLRTLHEEELPAFRGALESGVAGAIMLAYNRVNGVPAHTQPELVAEVRSWSDQSIAVMSDAGAPTLLVTVQRAQADHVSATAALLRSGVDSFTDDDANAAPTIGYLNDALAAGHLTTDDIDLAVLHLLELRVRTGEFDGDDDPYAGITAVDLDLPASRDLAREVVGSSLVVLRNDDAVLPLAEPGSICVIGPLADAVLMDWYSGTPPYEIGLASGLAERYRGARVEVVTGADTIALLSTSNGCYVAVSPDGSQVVADAETAGGDALFDVTDWGDGVLTIRSHASRRLLTGAHSPMRADADHVGEWVVQESFRRHVHEDGSWSLLHLGSGRWVRVLRDAGLLVAEAVTMDDAERFTARIVVAGQAAAAEAAASADVVFVAVGNEPHLAGRETQDRQSLVLPESLAELYRAARAVNAKTVLTIISSYPYVLPHGVRDAATAVWSSHAGQELGRGVADVLSGDREPRGRLTQSWPARAEQAGDLFDYDTTRQKATYRHQSDAFAFALGHGCTYSPVTYEAVGLVEHSVVAPAPTHRHTPFEPARDAARVRAIVGVRNRGDRAAEELVQLYVLPPADLPIAAPLRMLVAYRRLHLAPGEYRTVELDFELGRLAVWDESIQLPDAPKDWLHAGALRVQPGAYRIASGPSADALRVEDVVTVHP